MFNKKIHRQSVRDQRKKLTSSFIHQANQKIFERLIQLEPLAKASQVALYHSNENEVGTHALTRWLLQRDACVFFPAIENNAMQFYLYDERCLKKNRFGIHEPDSQFCERANMASLDIIVVPLVLFDSQCYRIGRGGGFYDRALAPLRSGVSRPYFLGLAYEFQRIPNCFPEPHDVSLDSVITENQVYVGPVL